MKYRKVSICQVALALVLPVAAIAEEQQSVEFARDIQPILQSRCESCHGTQEREGGLRFLSRADVLGRNDSGEPAVVPGKAAESILIQRVTSDDELERMPPEGRALSKAEVDVLKRWINQGAKWPRNRSAETHWAYVPPARPEVPQDASNLGRVTNAIDAFVLTELKSQNIGLSQSPSASPAKLLRRVSLDLIGLPPTLEQMEKFEADPSFANYQDIVDELLDSPRYGEKWARQWLDLARYADSNGFQADQFREIWAYRDWVINAFNSDMPYDRFTIEQLAGDLLPESTLDQRIATGFQRCTTCNVEAGVDPEENRTNQVIDRVNTLGTVWLGTSFECAQCHNHKYDPFTQEDYYQVFAYFNNTPLEVEQPNGTGVSFDVAGPKMDLPLEADLAAKLAKLQQQKQSIQNEITQRKRELRKSQSEWEAKLKTSLGATPEWHVLTPKEFASSGGAEHKVLDDSSVLLTGKAPDKDVYSITFQTELSGITGFKLETLTDESLPGKGPGRGDAERPNFVAYELTITTTAGADDNKPKPVSLHSAKADFSQKNYDVGGLIDGDPKTAWAINPKFHEPHWATFLVGEPIVAEGPITLKVTIDQHYGGARTIGRLRFSAMTGDPEAESIPQNIRDILAKTEKRSPADERALVNYQVETDGTSSDLQSQIKKLDQQINKIQPPTTLVMVEMEAPRETSIFKRGNFLSRGAEVKPGIPRAFAELAESNSGEGYESRLEFAKWLVSEANPLAARVAVNRWWAQFFGIGIVETLEDFGTQGSPPTHPELLDWLAVELMQHNWSMKHIHRTIVLSETYRQDSTLSPEKLERDPYNKFYGRGPRFRMSAEMIRDHALAVSGLISEKMGGPPIYPPQPENIWRHVGRNAPKYDTDTDEDRYRRGIYVVWRRSAPYPSFVNFDAPDRAACVVKRSRTNTPLQALTLLNDPAYVEMAQALAQRMVIDLPEADAKTRIEHGLLLTLSRPAESRETETLLQFFEAERDRLKESPKVAEEIMPKAWRVEKEPLVDQAAYFAVANVLLNLDETITKN